MKYQYIVIWYNKKKQEYYYRKVRGTYMNYEIGYINQYNHEVILVIDVNDLLYIKKPTFKTKLINRLIDLLNKFK